MKNSRGRPPPPEGGKKRKTGKKRKDRTPLHQRLLIVLQIGSVLATILKALTICEPNRGVWSRCSGSGPLTR